MAVIRYKVIVAEADGVELDYHEERSLDASNVYYNDINGDFDNLQDKVNDLDNLVATLVVPIVLSCLLYTSPSPRDVEESRMPSSA